MFARSVSSATGCGDLVAEWEIRVARTLASKYITNYRLLAELFESEDLRQEVLMQWVSVRGRYRKADGEALKGLMWRVGENHILQILRSLRTDRRRLLHEAMPFSRPISFPTGEERTVGDLADAALAPSGAAVPAPIRAAINSLWPELSDRGQDILRLLFAGVPQQEIASELGVNRDTIRVDLLRVRKLFTDRGLRKFLK